MTVQLRRERRRMISAVGDRRKECSASSLCCRYVGFWTFLEKKRTWRVCWRLNSCFGMGCWPWGWTIGSTEFGKDIDSLVEVDFMSSFLSGISQGRSSTTVRFCLSLLSTKALRIAAAAPFADGKRLPCNTSQTSAPAPPLTAALSMKSNSRSRS